MSPHRIDILPSAAALPQYGISKNGFLPAETPLSRLPHSYYQPWEQIIDQLPKLIDAQQIREWVDRLPVLTTQYLDSEPEWQRAHSMLAVIAQGYIWTGPEPSEVSRAQVTQHGDMMSIICSVSHQPSLPPSFEPRSISRCIPSPHMRH